MTVQERNEKNLRRRRRQAAKRNMFILLFTVLMITVGSVVFGSTFSSAKNEELQKYYKSIEIEKGDSLWTIAEEYHQDQCTTKEYVKELMELNDLSTDLIHEGQHLVVAYFK